MTTDFSPRPVLIDHWRSVRGARIMYGVMPMLAGVIAWTVDANVSTGAALACMTVAGLTSAVFLQLSLQVSARAAAWSDNPPDPGDHTSFTADRIDDMAANAVYGTLMSFVAVVAAFCVSVTKSGWPERIGSALTAAALIHVGHTLVLVGTRAYTDTVGLTKRVRGGAAQRDRSSR